MNSRYSLFLATLALTASIAGAQSPIPNLDSAGPNDFVNQKPLLYFGVKSCGEYVIWLVFENDIRCIDKDHSPKDMTEFMRSLEKSHIPGDVAIIACTAASI